MNYTGFEHNDQFYFFSCILGEKCLANLLVSNVYVILCVCVYIRGVLD